MDLHQLRFALLKISVVVLSLTSWIFFSFVFETAPVDEEEPQTSTMVSSLVRLPASLPDKVMAPGGVLVPALKAVEPVHMDIVKVACWDQTPVAARSISSRWIRLTGRACQGVLDSESVTVLNLSNGYVATVFDAKPGSLTTDFIPLESGKNDILIRFQKEAGASVENKLVLNR